MSCHWPYGILILHVSQCLIKPFVEKFTPASTVSVALMVSRALHTLSIEYESVLNFFFRATSCNLRRILAFWYQSYYWYCSGPFNGDHNDQYTLPLLSIATLLNPGEFLAKQALSLLFISFTICMIKYMLTLLYPRQILKVMLEKMLDKS